MDVYSLFSISHLGLRAQWARARKIKRIGRRWVLVSCPLSSTVLILGQLLFTVDSKRFCTECNKDVHVSFGGEANWNFHLASARHRRNTDNAKIPDFFAKDVPKASSSNEVIPTLEPVSSHFFAPRYGNAAPHG